MQKLIIRFEHEYGAEECSFEQPDIANNDLFWIWFLNVWPALGFDFVKAGIEKND